MEEKFSREQLESKEKESRQPDLKVDFIRHGKPEYTDEEFQSAKFEGNLTREGIEQVKESANELANKIDKEKELVVLWVSPKRRTQQTAEIFFDVFKEKGVPVIKDPKTVKSLSDVKVSPDFVADAVKNNAAGNWMEYWAEADLPEDTEKPEEVRTRVERLITYLERISRNIAPEGNRKLHFVCVGHEEIFRDLLEEGYGVGTKNHSGPTYAEIMSVDIRKSEQGENAKLKLVWEGQEAELDFDKENRKFYNTKATR